MKTAISIILFALTVCSCNEIKEEDNIPTSKVELLTSLEETEEEEKTQTIDSVKSSEKILLTGRGSEPGWSAEFYADRVKLTLDHGEISEVIAHDFSNVASDKLFKLSLSNITTLNGKKEIKKFSVVIETVSCKEESTGEMKDRKITVIFNDKTYNGCAGI